MAAFPPQMPQGGAPQGQPGGGALSQLSSKGGAPLLQLILGMLAGAGVGPMIQSLSKLASGFGQGRGSQGGDPNRPHRGGVKIQAGPPGATVTPSAQQPGATGGQDPTELIKQLLMMRAAQGGGAAGAPPF